MSAGKKPTVDEVVGVAEALTTGLGVAALGVAAEVIGEAVNMTNANAKANPEVDSNGLSQVIRPAWRVRCGSGLGERTI
jgi:hypothetical protein